MSEETKTPPKEFEFLDPTLEELLFKRSGIISSRDKISTIVLGSSHGDYAFNPEFFPGSYNLCTVSQDLLHSAALYECVARFLPKLSNIILFYSVFSPGFELSKCGEKLRCAAYKEIFNINVDFQDPEIEEAYQSITGTFQNKSVENSSFGYKKTNDRFFFKDITVEARVETHLPFALLDKGDSKYTEQFFHLQHIVKHTKELGHNLIVVIAPARTDYRNALPNKDILFKKLLDFHQAALGSKDEFKLLDLFKENICGDDNFGDFDHILPESEGPQKITRKILLSCLGIDDPF